MNLLKDIGLTENQANAYKALIVYGQISASRLAELINESRTNGYKILDSLCSLGLASKETTENHRVIYAAINPTALDKILAKKSDKINSLNKRLNSQMPNLISFFFEHSEQPGVRFFQGQQGILKIYKEQLETGQPLYYIRSVDDVRFLSFEDMHKIRNMFPKKGIKRQAITPDAKFPAHLPPKDLTPVAESDKAMLLERTWVDENDYSEPVEWTVYGDKLSIISYGKEAFGMVIDSAQIAQAFKQLFSLLNEGLRRAPGYQYRPLKMTHTATPVGFKKLP